MILTPRQLWMLSRQTGCVWDFEPMETDKLDIISVKADGLASRYYFQAIDKNKIVAICRRRAKRILRRSNHGRGATVRHGAR